MTEETKQIFTYAAYGVVTVLLWGYAMWLWTQTRALRRRTDRE